MRFVAVAAALLLGVAAMGAAPATPGQRATVLRGRAFGRELLIGGDAEREVQGYAPGWFPARLLESAAYGFTPGEWDGERGITGGGTHYLRLAIPDGVDSARVSQWVQVGAESIAIDSGLVRARLAGQLGALVNGPVGTRLHARFVDAAGRRLGEFAIESPPGPGLPRPESGAASLQPLERSVAVPEGTRRIEVRITAHIVLPDMCAHCNAVALADNVSLTLSRTAATR